MITGVTEITEFFTKADMARWTRAHADSSGITWSVFPGADGTMIVVEHEADRSTLAAAPDTGTVTPPPLPAAEPAAWTRCPDCEGNDVWQSAGMLSCRACLAEWRDPKAGRCPVTGVPVPCNRTMPCKGCVMLGHAGGAIIRADAPARAI